MVLFSITSAGAHAWCAGFYLADGFVAGCFSATACTPSDSIWRSLAVETRYLLPNFKTGISPRWAASYEALRANPKTAPAFGMVVVGCERMRSHSSVFISNAPR
jgi:hypothetical protein